MEMLKIEKNPEVEYYTKLNHICLRKSKLLLLSTSCNSQLYDRTKISLRISFLKYLQHGKNRLYDQEMERGIDESKSDITETARGQYIYI